MVDVFQIIHSYAVFRIMMFNATFNNISVISWRSDLLVEKPRVSGENHRPAASHWQTLSHKIVVHLYMSGIRTHNFSDYMGRCKSNYYAITTAMAPL